MNINCDIIKDLLPLYNDGALSEASRNAVREHIKTCPDCRRYKRSRKITSYAEKVDTEGDFLSISRRIIKRRRRNGVLLGLSAAVFGLAVGYAVYRIMKK